MYCSVALPVYSRLGGWSYPPHGVSLTDPPTEKVYVAGLRATAANPAAAAV